MNPTVSPLLAGGEAKTERDMTLAGAGIAQSDHILPALDVCAARQFQDQHFVERGDRLEVEAVQALGRRELRLSDPPLDHSAFAVDQFQLGQAEQIAHVVDALGGTLAGNLVVLAQEGRKLEGLQVMGQQHLWRVGHGAAPSSRLI